jgi:hypothetical protein
LSLLFRLDKGVNNEPELGIMNATPAPNLKSTRASTARRKNTIHGTHRLQNVMRFIALAGLAISLWPTISVCVIAAKTFFWKRTQCTVIVSEVNTIFPSPRCALDTGIVFLHVQFEYTADDLLYTSTIIQNLEPTEDVEKLKAFPRGRTTSCYVNPLNHSEAALLRWPPLDEILSSIDSEYDSHPSYLWLAAISALVGGASFACRSNLSATLHWAMSSNCTTTGSDH